MDQIKSKNDIDKLSVIAIIVPVILTALNLITTTITIAILGFQFIILGIKIKKKKFKLSIKEQRILAIVIIFYLFTYLLDIFGRYTSMTLTTTTLVFLNIILNFVMVCFTYNKKETFLVIAKIFVIFVIFLCVYAIVVRIFGGTPKPYTDENGEKQYKQVVQIGGIHLYQRAMGDSQGKFGVTSLTKNPNTFSYLILYAFVINIILINTNRELRKKNGLNYINIILFLVGVYIAGSRLAIILIPLSYIAIKIIYIKKKRLFSLILIGAIASILIGGIYLVANIESLKLIDLNGRDELWAIMPKVMDESLIIGQGLDASRNIVFEETGMDLTMFNSYFTMIANYGLVVTIIFYGILVYVIFSYFRKCKEEKDISMKGIYIITTILLAIGLIQGLVENNILRFSVWNTIYVVLLTLSESINNKEIED